MRDALIMLLLVAVGGLAYFSLSQYAAIKDHERQIRELNAKVESRSKMASLELQEKCSKQAALAYAESGWAKEPAAGYENHYNDKLNKCFVIMQNMDTKTEKGRVITTKFLSDAFEGKNLGNYFWESDKVKKFWEVAPSMCDVTVPSGEKKVCHSSDEFEELIKVYMQ